MKIVFPLIWFFSINLAASDLEALKADALKGFKDEVAPFVKEYCTDCHGSKRRKAGLNFDKALKNPGNTLSRRMWKKALANVKAHDMPPPKSDQPFDDERKEFLDAIGKIKYLSDKDPGQFVIRRLTKVEYGNTMRDLLGVDPSIAADLPNEVAGQGYLNNLSPLQSEQYLAIAKEVLNQSDVQDRLFGKLAEPGDDLRLSAGKYAKDFAQRAYRRPLSDSELEALLKVFDLGQANQLDYQSSLQLVTRAILVSPQFLFITPGKEATSDKEIVPLDNYQLASRLSYLLWSTMPDAELFKLADAGKLKEPAVLQSQVKRLLKDDRSRALFDGFGAQWLGVEELDTQVFDKALFPEMTPEMRTSMYDEARLFFESVVRENQSVVNFVESNYTFLNGAVAGLYGLEQQVKGPKMRRVTLVNGNRGGILAMPAVLAGNSFPNRTSPVNRGVWVLEQVLGEHIPPAPANVPALEKQNQQQVANLTLRQRTELHRSNATCANCHKILDPIGFGLENFDAIGRWRDRDSQGGKIDSAGELPSGETFSTPAELKAIIGSRQEALARNLTEKLLAYALCRQLEGYDEIVVDQLMARIAKDGYRMQTLVSEVVTSYPFTHKRIRQ